MKTVQTRSTSTSISRKTFQRTSSSLGSYCSAHGLLAAVGLKERISRRLASEPIREVQYLGTYLDRSPPSVVP
jgi:hypothetical protein